MEKRGSASSCATANEDALVKALRLTMGMLEFSVDGLIREVNRRYLELSGFAENELIGKSYRMVFKSEGGGPEDEFDRFWRRLAAGETIHGQFCRRRRNGDLFWIDAVYVPIRGDSGAVSGVVEYCSDITVSHDFAKKLEERASAIRGAALVAEYSPDARLVSVNPVFAGSFGYSETQMIGMKYAALFSRERREAPDFSKPWDMIRAGSNHSALLCMQTAREEPIWLETIFAPLKDESGALRGALQLAIDVTERILREMMEMEEIEKFSLAVAETWNAVVIIDPRERVIFINSGFTRMFGYTSEDILGRSISLVFGQREKSVTREYRKTLETRTHYQTEEITYGKNGQRLWVSLSAKPVYAPSGEHDFTVCVFTDITDTKMREVLQNRAVDAMARDVTSDEVLELICSEVERIVPEAKVAIIGLDENGRLYPMAAPSLSEACRKSLLGLSAFDHDGSAWRAIATGKNALATDLKGDASIVKADPFLEMGIKAYWSVPIRKADGHSVGAVTFYYMDKRGPDAFQQSLADIVVNLCALAIERKSIREAMRQVSFYDPLTNLPNRNLLLANAEKMLLDNRRAKNDLPVAVMCLNINRFRQINSSLGYDAGNVLLSLIAIRLTEGRYADDIVGRVGADEFAIVLPGCDELNAANLAGRILAAVSAPCRIAGVDITPSASIGISLYPNNGYSMEVLLNNAANAMTMAKNNDQGQFGFYSEENNVRARHSLSLESCLRNAVQADEFRLLYQPQVFFDTGKLHGVEALSRWNNPEFGTISPSRFIPLAEEAGLINGISDWVIAEVCRQMGEWRRQGVPIPTVSINLSAPNFRDLNLPGRIWECLQNNGLEPSDIILELTESVLLDDNPKTLETVRNAYAMGMRLSLDDFGTGYSSLAYLRNFPISEIKLDQSFVRDLESDPASRKLSQAIMRLGENLGLRVIVEGVETREQYDLLKNQGFHILQGFFVTRPLAPEGLKIWLDQYAPMAAQGAGLV